MRALFERFLHEEDGNTILIVAAFLPVVIGLIALVADVGNGFTHRRHLQTQADAGVLAAGSEFAKCASGTAAANDALESAARDYAINRNPQVGGAASKARVSASVNGTGYGAADDSLGKPCDTGFIDLKLTDSDVPPFVAMTGNQTVHAHARLKVFELDSARGLLPIAAEDPTPQTAKAIFVDEKDGTTIATAPLTRDGSSGGMSIWDNAAAPAPVPVNARDIGVRVVLSGATSTTCGDPLVVCYDRGSTKGLLHVQGWSSAGTVKQDTQNKTQDAPLVRSVRLFNGSCTDPYFSAGGCTIGVRAKVDWGGDPANVGGSLTATVAGTKYVFPAGNYDPTSGDWTSNAIPIAAGAGPQDVQLDWAENKGKIGTSDCAKKTCTGSFGVVQRHFSARDDRSGPIKLAQLSEGGTLWPNSLQQGGTHNLVVKIGVQSNFGLEISSKESDPIVPLRVVSGSQTQSLDCDPGTSQLKGELASGCSPKYARNTGTACPGNASALWSTAQPWHCVALQTGGAQNQVPAGLNQRILGSNMPASCTAPNHWSSFDETGVAPGDPRLVNVFVTPFGSSDGSGSNTVPVRGIASFYITGWTGSGGGFSNPCQGNGDDPAPDQGTIVGHFVKYVQPNDGDPPSDTPCDFQALETCTAVLVE